MKGVNPLMVTLVTLSMVMVGFFIISFFIKPIERIECEMNSDCSINCTKMLPNPKCKDGKCVCVAMCMSDTSCSYLGEGYSCKNEECIKE
jgi:hypothetical protein